MSLSDQQLERYARHIMLDEIGLDGQQRLQASKIALIGAGGLGCPALTYLASAGVGQLVIIDDDTIELANLQRQFLFTDADIGKSKVEVISSAVSKINPDCKTIIHQTYATSDNLAELIKGCTVVIDGCDNFVTRHSVNQACHLAKIPLVSGAAERFDGQVSVFNFAATSSPCYACLYPITNDVQPTPCSILGVFAPLTGLIGSLMASEALKLVATTSTTTLQAKLLAIDLAEMRIRNLTLRPTADCPICSANQ